MSLPTRLYFGLPVWAQNALLSTYGLSLKGRRYGGGHRAAVAEPRSSQWVSATDLEAMQLARVNELIAHASENVPWYGSLGSSRAPLGRLADLAALPTLSKDDLRAHLSDFVSRAPRKGRLHEVHTGGTTGTPLTIYCDRLSLHRNYAFFARLRHCARLPL